MKQEKQYKVESLPDYLDFTTDWTQEQRESWSSTLHKMFISLAETEDRTRMEETGKITEKRIYEK